jgi:hypothetical protein
MLLNLNSFFFSSYTTYILIYSVITNYSLKFYNTNTLDNFARIYSNEFFLNTYYYYWTIYWFIPILLTTVMYVYLVNTNVLIRLNNIYLYTFILYFITLDTMNYFFLNNQFDKYLSRLENYNILLQNSINKYHPLLFYSVLIICTIICIYKLNSVNIYSKKLIKYFNIDVTYYLISYITSLFLTLLLGSWWAWQEGSWGGWWNWDPSEVFGLAVIVVLTIFNHLYTHNYTMYLRYYYYLYSIILILFFYFFLQINFDLISHNFGIKLTQFVNTLHNYMFILLLLIYCFIYSLWFIYSYTISLYWYIFTKNNSNYTQFQYAIFKYTIFIFIFYEVMLSFIPLVNDFVWKIYSILLPNINFNSYYVNGLLLILFYSIIISFYNYNTYLSLLITVILNYNIFLYFNINYNHFTIIRLFHIVLIFYITILLPTKWFDFFEQLLYVTNYILIEESKIFKVYYNVLNVEPFTIFQHDLIFLNISTKLNTHLNWYTLNVSEDSLHLSFYLNSYLSSQVLFEYINIPVNLLFFGDILLSKILYIVLLLLMLMLYYIRQLLLFSKI